MPLSNDDLLVKTTEELLILVIEEASEVIHAACKTIRFGVDGFRPEGTKWERGNLYALCVEGEQLTATLQTLGGRHGIGQAGLEQIRTMAAAKQKEEFGDL